MGYTAQSFTVGQKLTSTQLNTIDQNFDAIADGDPSAPRLGYISVDSQRQTKVYMHKEESQVLQEMAQEITQ